MSDQTTTPVPSLSDQEQARYADQLLKNPLLEQLFVEMDQQAVIAWRRSSSREQREELWHTVIAVWTLRKQIESRVTNLKVAAETRARRNRPTV